MSLFTNKASLFFVLLTTAALCNRYDVQDACVYTTCSPYLHGVAALKLTRRVELAAAAVASGPTSFVQQDFEQEPQVPSQQYTDAAHLLSAEFPSNIEERFPAVLMAICPNIKDAEQVIECYRRSAWAGTWADMAANDRSVRERASLSTVKTPKWLLDNGYGI